MLQKEYGFMTLTETYNLMASISTECEIKLKEVKLLVLDGRTKYKLGNQILWNSMIWKNMYEGQSISNASYFFSFTFQENLNTIT